VKGGGNDAKELKSANCGKILKEGPRKRITAKAAGGTLRRKGDTMKRLQGERVKGLQRAEPGGSFPQGDDGEIK